MPISSHLLRLVYAVYIATVDTLTNTALYRLADPMKGAVPNIVLSRLGHFLPSTADSIISTDDVVSISRDYR